MRNLNRKAINGSIFAFGMFLVGSGMFLASLMMGTPLTGTAFNVAWLLVTMGLFLAVFWLIVHLRATRKEP
ncbi:hypothetical protein E4J89_19070 [Arthrobacter sp. CAU 1506]|uniref:hypothetical protein n=1 Tax=Arthrobacter sp. CAU 1506 TaxID=2560052 RepID=UPI0010ACB004|nr:hypothetical protein [Arthrobacter sp. CAU 1506]TJY64047.1 hypothetical protein E4J89_19070 [Arthrobacter sp. CAU 1506]